VPAGVPPALALAPGGGRSAGAATARAAAAAAGLPPGAPPPPPPVAVAAAADLAAWAPIFPAWRACGLFLPFSARGRRFSARLRARLARFAPGRDYSLD